MRFGFVGASYTARSAAAADEECINLYAESLESQGAISPGKAYGGSTAQGRVNYFGTPGLLLFATIPTPTRGSIQINGRAFFVGGTSFVEVFANGTQTTRGPVVNDGKAVSMAASNIQILIVSAGHAYCFTLATNTLVDITAAVTANIGNPVQVQYSHTVFIASDAANKFCCSNFLDGVTWPGLTTSALGDIADNIVSTMVVHGELWIWGNRHALVYQDTGSDEIFDVIEGTQLEIGSAATFGPALVDNVPFWVSEDDRGGRMAWRANGYTPQRISTHAVEVDLSSYAEISGLVSYSYQDGGHLFWVLYIPGSKWSWVFDVSENLWHKRAAWASANWQAHWSWNHVYAFGKHLVGDWKTGNIYQFDAGTRTDNGNVLKPLRRAPTIIDEMNWVTHRSLTIDIQTGLGPQPPLLDGNYNPRAPQCMLRWSDDRGSTWSNEHVADMGMAGEFQVRVIYRRLGRSRYRVYEWSMTDPVPVCIVDAYLDTE